MLLKIEKLDNHRIRVAAPAKVNLFLEILSQRPDGYHNLNSLFQAVGLYDYLTFELTDEPEIELTLANKLALPLDRTNLIHRAWEAVRVQYNRTNGAKIRLEKNIPIAAGLAGGSADAAATLVAANFLMGLNLNKEQLAHIGLGIGSDLPFFFSTGQAIVTGRGEVVTPTKFPTDYSLILVTPNLTISTAEAYGSLRIDLTKPKEPFSLSRCSTVMDLVVQIGRSVNDFEDAHFLSYPALGKIKNGLLQIGASLVRMSGSGPTLFGLFYHPPDLKKRIPNIEDDWIVNTAKPVISI
jgi:4-diphosphocytidyl-2-C-methyl-D-erythritol kinase